MSREQVIDVVCNYFAFECGVRNLAPDSIWGCYLPGVINLLTLNRYASAAVLRAASTDGLVKMIYNGFERLYRMVNPKAASIKLAFTACSAVRSHALLRSGESDFFRELVDSRPFFEGFGCFRIFSALLFGIMSEFLSRQEALSPHS